MVLLERVQVRVLPVVNRAAEQAPMATVCCNACRACVQTNIAGLVLVAAGSVAAFAGRLAAQVRRMY
jgi:hypothetical protein